MTPEDWAKALVMDHGITQQVGSKHENPGAAVRLIAAVIGAAVAAERERCAKRVEELGGLMTPEVLAGRIREGAP